MKTLFKALNCFLVNNIMNKKKEHSFLKKAVPFLNYNNEVFDARIRLIFPRKGKISDLKSDV